MLKNNLVGNSDQNEHYYFLATILTKRINSLTKKFQNIEENLSDNPKERKKQYQNLFLVSLELDGNIYSAITGEFKKESWGWERYLNKEIILQALTKELQYSKNISRWLLYFR